MDRIPRGLIFGLGLFVGVVVAIVCPIIGQAIEAIGLFLLCMFIVLEFRQADLAGRFRGD